MPQRSSALPIVIVSLGAIAAASVTASAPARSADECITKPIGAAPQGQHWYYRRDQTTRRQCWFLAPKGAKLQKTPARDAKPRAPEAPAPLPVLPPARPPAIQPSAATTAAGANSALPESALRMRWPDAGGYADAPPSVAPGSMTVVVEAPQAPGPTAPASPASAEPSQEPQWPATAGAPQRTDAPVAGRASPREPDHLLALILITLALLIISGPVWYAGFRPRRRETRDRAGVAWLRQSRPSASRAGSWQPVDCQADASARQHVPPSTPEPFDWSREFAKAWQQLSEDCQARRTPALSASRS